MTHRRWGSSLAVLCAALGVGGCATPAGTNASLGAGVVALGHTPTTNINQVYYLGVFDPRGQLPPTIYRIRVQGQASALSWTKFASGWVRADLIDSLSGKVGIDKAGTVDVADKSDSFAVDRGDEKDKGLLTGRRLVMFGPEGFREAPKDHRLVIVMGSSPDTFFNAVDQALGVVASVTQGTSAGPAIEKALWSELARLRVERQKIDDVIDRLSD